MINGTYSRWTRIVSPIAALWYAFGLSQAIMGYLAEAASMPILIWAAYFIATIAGIVGSGALFFAPSHAFKAFVLSLISAITFYVWLFGFGSPLPEDYGIGTMVIGVTLVLTVLSSRLK